MFTIAVCLCGWIAGSLFEKGIHKKEVAHEERMKALNKMLGE